MHQARMLSADSPQPGRRGTDSPASSEPTPANKGSPAPPQQQRSPAADQSEGAAEETGEGSSKMTLDIASFRKPGEKTFTQRARLFVGSLPLDVTEEEFKNLFAKYGKISDVFINRERGFGFETRTLAEIAKVEVDGTVLNNRPLKVRFATHGAALTVRNLLPVVTNELLEKLHHFYCDREREQPPRFAQPGTFEFEYASRWKALDEMEKQQREQVDRNIKEAKEKLESELEAAKNEHQLMLMRQGKR
ncbi:hypothetical protein XENOCAPTIV_024526 [Xenoophorus captivus]|uniref:RRM domain-containing protein n=1 Tax=Xenoophorus captivus TaxID=1517983 RepID=A0ABV0QMU5_9TELE